MESLARLGAVLEAVERRKTFASNGIQISFDHPVA
jgi:hypothetical protein